MASWISLAGKTALITGASRGIGRAVALALAAQGVRLALGASGEEQLKSLEEEIRPYGVETLLCPDDLSQPDVPDRIVSRIKACYGSLDFLINNAGVALSRSISDTTIEDWEYQMAVNARAPFFLCREALPLLKHSETPSIINISSVVGIKGYVDQGAYTASKHALMGFSKVLARELHPLGIRVHIVSPGGVATDLVSAMRPDLIDQPLISPQEMADIVLFLLTHRGNAVIDELNVRRVSNEPWK